MNWNIHKKILLTGLNTAPAFEPYPAEPACELEWDPTTGPDQALSAGKPSYKKLLYASIGLAVLVHLFLFVLWNRVGLSEAVSSVTPLLMTFTFSFENAEPLPMLNQNPPSAPLKSTQIATAKPSRKPALTTSAPIKEEPKLESEPEGVGEQPSPAPGLSSASGNSLITPTFEIEATQASESKRETTFAGLYLNDTPSSSVYSTAYQVSSGTVSLPFINASRQSHIGPPLEYPALALRRGYEGIVLIKIDVDRQGKVTHVQLLESSGYDILDQEVLKAAKKWLYKPAKKGNEPIEDSVKAIIRFLINEPIDVH